MFKVPESLTVSLLLVLALTEFVKSTISPTNTNRSSPTPKHQHQQHDRQAMPHPGQSMLPQRYNGMWVEIHNPSQPDATTDNRLSIES